jgi:hypothetical protein
MIERTQLLKAIELGSTPRLLSCTSSWNLIGKGFAMFMVMRYAAQK